jgi:methylated-DNA-[protein]-cysteine S-methyltransferase
MHTAIVKTPFGKIKMSAREYLTRIEFLTEDVPLSTSKQPIIHQVVYELNSYFRNPHFKFTIPYQITGTTFQKRVWNALSDLPRGTTITYGELAQKLETGARAIGQACRTNPLPLFIPCHRVISQHGIGGFSGDCTGKKIAIKQWLLHHETSYAI